MKSRHIRIATILGVGGLMSMMFMNGSRVNWEEATLEKVDLQVRNTHARELLGPSYRKSAARFHERNANLSKDILRRVKRNLPVAKRKQAAGLTRTILAESKKYGLDPIFVLAIIQTESRWNPDAIGGVGEIGLMQIRPETAEWMANRLKIRWRGKQTLHDPSTNVVLGLAYMNYLRSTMGHNAMKYVSAYNMGPKTVRRLLAQKIKPSEYRARVLGNYELLYKGLPSAGVGMTTARL